MRRIGILTLGLLGGGLAPAATACRLGDVLRSPESPRAPNDSTPTTSSGRTLTGLSGGGQSDTVGATLPAPYVVRLTDASGQPVAGATVTWTVVSGGGSIAPASTTTDANGEASATATLGTTAGAHRVQAAVGGAAGSPVVFTATVGAGTPVTLSFDRQPSNTAAGSTISPAVVVALRDSYGNLAGNYSGTVTISIVPLTGTPLATLSGTLTRSLSGGRATFDDLSIDLVGAGYELRAAGTDLTTDSAGFDVL